MDPEDLQDFDDRRGHPYSYPNTKMNKDIKQVLVVRKDLNMRKGKIAAQCAHAVMAVFFDKLDKFDLIRAGALHYSYSLRKTPYFEEFIEGSFKKIVVYVNSEEELKNIHQKALDAEIHTSLILDSGLTEFGGVHTYTVCAVGPWDGEEINKITGHLPLL